ncbi:MAG: hypothetical protein QF681_19645, partial [Vicinamibacterales bacterium]|nr:hypothetical protein [Vicinamibacterales bacterium]
LRREAAAGRLTPQDAQARWIRILSFAGWSETPGMEEHVTKLTVVSTNVVGNRDDPDTRQFEREARNESLPALMRLCRQ